MTILNHQAVVLLPYHIDSSGELHIVMEQKSADYKPPFFDNALNLLGGNWQKGMHQDKSPEEVINREILEEFWSQAEVPESFNKIIGEEFLSHESDAVTQYDPDAIQRIRPIGHLLLDGFKPRFDYIAQANPPLTEKVKVYGASLFLRNLSSDELHGIEEVLAEFDGKVTTDNVEYGGKVVTVSLSDINKHNLKFAWGYEILLNDLADQGVFGKVPGVIRQMRFMDYERLNYSSFPVDAKERNPSFDEIEAQGLEYRCVR